MNAQQTKIAQSLGSALEAVPVGVVVLNEDSMILAANSRCLRMFDYRPEDLIGRAVTLLMPDHDSALAADTIAPGQPGSSEDEVSCGWQLRAMRRDNTEFLVNVEARSTVVEGEALTIESIQDVSAGAYAREGLTYLPDRDALTGLGNRLQAMTRVQQLLDTTDAADRVGSVALLIQVGHLKQIHGTYGYAAGDQLLQFAARRLCRVIADNEQASPVVISHLDGDEFALLVSGLAERARLDQLILQLREALSKPYELDGESVVQPAYFGIVDQLENYDSAHDVMRDASAALHESRTRIANDGVAYFSPTIREALADRLMRESDLQQALDEQQFDLEYQPIIALDTANVAGVEALLRWRHPERGMVPFAQFVSVAEDVRQIKRIGDWYIRTACQQLNDWRQLADRSDLYVRVNLAASQLADSQFVSRLLEHADAADVGPAYLQLQIDQAAVMDQTGPITSNLASMRNAGFTICLSCSQTPVSLLGRLQELPIDVLKIDRALVASIDMGDHYAAMVESAVRLARRLGIAVVAEGIDTAEQSRALKAWGCDSGQVGSLNAPIDQDQATSLVQASDAHSAKPDLVV